MHTDADGNIVFTSLRGGFYKFTVAILLSLGALFLLLTVYCFQKGDHIGGYVLLFIAMVMVLITIGFMILASRIRYILERDGVRLRHSIWMVGVRIQEFIPYTSITKFYGTTRLSAPAFSPVTSPDAVMIVFTNDNGRRGDMIAVSPDDKKMFISELTGRTGILVSDDPHAK
jgi:hypothetical protein